MNNLLSRLIGVACVVAIVTATIVASGVRAAAGVATRRCYGTRAAAVL